MQGGTTSLAQLLLQTNMADQARIGNHYSGEPTAIPLATVALRQDSAAHTEYSKIFFNGRQWLLLWRTNE